MVRTSEGASVKRVIAVLSVFSCSLSVCLLITKKSCANSFPTGLPPPPPPLALVTWGRHFGHGHVVARRETDRVRRSQRKLHRTTVLHTSHVL